MGLLDLPNELLVRVTEWTDYDLALAGCCRKLREIHLSGDRWVDRHSDAYWLWILRKATNRQFRRLGDELRIEASSKLVERYAGGSSEEDPFSDGEISGVWSELLAGLDFSDAGLVARLKDTLWSATIALQGGFGSRAEQTLVACRRPGFARFLHRKVCSLLEAGLSDYNTFDRTFVRWLVEFGLRHDSVELRVGKGNFGVDPSEYLWFVQEAKDEASLVEFVDELTNPDRGHENWFSLKRWLRFYRYWVWRYPNKASDPTRGVARQKIVDSAKRTPGFLISWDLQAILEENLRSDRCSVGDFVEIVRESIEIGISFLDTNLLILLAFDPCVEKYEVLLRELSWQETHLTCALVKLVENSSPHHRCVECLISDPRITADYLPYLHNLLVEIGRDRSRRELVAKLQSWLERKTALGLFPDDPVRLSDLSQ